ncbi:undecaprenyl-phosphate 4-deoxy-4-formamido-L-arabinose transferase [Cryobacterium psychrotolerans]|uniref:Undecaprenyl-phosphate 4-deoxy-4-formamido-L-arabinose transferase n=1 Tax=Cryobacterium psychrotolerans TaxID=386301 RepID=A0A1G9BWY4_9MICO|nr:MULTISPECIES: glycosyltransferase family 2 protein [Cryobacterium]TFD42936.1 glycosyltransferase family 2 protein [Cryobacterium sp. TMT1-2-1]TFD84105.1 glycosyltransferase family 2 protein [Cryobacterium psychrotolerans]SDK43475.1 undecaprenyl-phosphate 4-deoxy-4-formamido-L-arabinose transferase [Cryobacterium psychrotolerans]
MQLHHLAVVMPAHNEAEGLPGFLAEIAEHVAPLADLVSIVVVNDVSTDSTAKVLAALLETSPGLTVITAAINRGHGPTALAAYRAGLALEPDAIVHVDGDGQFEGKDFPALVHALDGADVVHGVREQRTEPWYRRVLTGSVGLVVALATGARIPDVNTPLRAYRPDVLARLVDLVPEAALVPHVHFSVAERRLGLRVRHVPVRSIPRRGSVATGSMWGEQAKQPMLPPPRLRDFSRRAALEVWQYSLRPGLDKLDHRVEAAAASGAPRP